MNPRWFLRMSRMAHKRPSERKFKLVVGVIVFCLILYGIERVFGWPDWLTANRPRRTLF